MKGIITAVGALALVGGMVLFWGALTTAVIGQAMLYGILSVAAFVFAGVMLTATRLNYD